VLIDWCHNWRAVYSTIGNNVSKHEIRGVIFWAHDELPNDVSHIIGVLLWSVETVFYNTYILFASRHDELPKDARQNMGSN
jgi:hypothetical protein